MLAALARAFEDAPDRMVLGVCVLARVGAALALVPGLGERGIPARVRLGVALAATLVVAPALIPDLMDRVPRTPAALALTLGAEALAGLILGLGFRALVFALHVAGSVAAASLSVAHLFQNPTAGEVEPVLASLFTMAGIALALIAGLHVDAVAALLRLYAVLPFGLVADAGDAAGLGVVRAAEAFGLGLSLAMPFVLVSLAYNLALGALSRAMPSLMVALVGAPLLMLLGLGTIWLSLPELFARWAEAREAVALDPLGGLGLAP